MKILLGVTGSVAAIKLPALAFSLQSLGEVKVVTTNSALKIIKRIHGYELAGNQFRKIVASGSFQRSETVLELQTDEQEWCWDTIGDPVLHIDLKDWADILVIAPLTANTLAKMAIGLCDNLLTCIYRAWPMNKPIVVAPAMNTDMLEHPVTSEHLAILHKRHARYRPMRQNSWEIDEQNFVLVSPVTKKLACGTTGIGAMAEPATIVEVVKKCLE